MHFIIHKFNSFNCKTFLIDSEITTITDEFMSLNVEINYIHRLCMKLAMHDENFMS